MYVKILSKVWISNCSLAGIAGSNLSWGIVVSFF
jgi:hypothetical protein